MVRTPAVFDARACGAAKRLRPGGHGIPTMIPDCRRLASLAAIFVTILASCIAAGPTGPRPDEQLLTQASPQGTIGESPAAAAGKAGEPKGDAGASDEIRYRFDPDVPLYYIIENEFRDNGGVPGLLTYAVSIKDRRVITQRAQSAKTTTQPKPPGGIDGKVPIVWECTRYEVREKGMRPEVSFDSLRDLYPPPSLYGLGSVPGSRVSFWLDPETGQVSGLSLVPAPIGGKPPATRRLSRTASKCSLAAPVLEGILYDLGPLFLPAATKQVGDQWTSRQSETVEPFGTVATRLTCTLRSVRESGERKIAVIDLSGELTLPAQQALAAGSSTTNPATTKPSQPAPGEAGPQGAAPPLDSVSGAPRGRCPAASQPGEGVPSTTAPSVVRPTPIGDETTTKQATSRPAASSGPAVSRPATSGPATTKPATSGPASRPTTQPGQPTKPKPFLLDVASCTGTVEFDLTHGELIGMTIRRELNGAAKLDVVSSDPLIPTEIRVGTFHEMRVTVSRTAPAQPVIVGGPKPPIVPLDEVEEPRPATTKPAATSKPAITTRPAISSRPATTQHAQPPTGRPPGATTRPEGGAGYPPKPKPSPNHLKPPPLLQGPPAPPSTTQSARRPPGPPNGPTTRPEPGEANGARSGTTPPSLPKPKGELRPAQPRPD